MDALNCFRGIQTQLWFVDTMSSNTLAKCRADGAFFVSFNLKLVCWISFQLDHLGLKLSFRVGSGVLGGLLYSQQCWLELVVDQLQKMPQSKSKNT